MKLQRSAAQRSAAQRSAAQRSAANLSVSRTALLGYGKIHPYLLQTKKFLSLASEILSVAFEADFR
jgi:hypothetical protein